MRPLLRLSLPLTLWLAAFSGIYGLHGLLCSSRFAEDAVLEGTGRLLLVGAGLFAVALQASLLFALRSPRFGETPGLAGHLAQALGLVALFATVWTLLPVVATSHCT